MPIVSTYSVSTASSITLSTEFSTIDELLIQLPDNTANIITAEDIRDSVYTLWQRVENVNDIASSAASASAFFQNSSPTPVTVGGIPSGTTFITPTDMQTMWNQLLYPYIALSTSLSLSPTQREYGNTSGLNTNSVSLNWSVTKNSDTITSITVDGIAQVPTGNSQIGVKLATATHSWDTSLVSQVSTFNMSAFDGTTTSNASAGITWMNQRYWGRIDLSSIGNPNLTTNPGSASSVASLCTDTLIRSLTGASVGSGKELSTSKDKTYNGINGSGQYLIFAWPSSVSGALSPTFTVNGLPSTAFTRVRTASPFVNQFGFTTNYEVWVSNTLQNSPLNIVIS